MLEEKLLTSAAIFMSALPYQPSLKVGTLQKFAFELAQISRTGSCRMLPYGQD